MKKSWLSISAYVLMTDDALDGVKPAFFEVSPHKLEVRFRYHEAKSSSQVSDFLRSEEPTGYMVDGGMRLWMLANICAVEEYRPPQQSTCLVGYTATYDSIEDLFVAAGGAPEL